MTHLVLILVLALLAAVLAIVDLFRSRGTLLLAWGLLAAAVALVLVAWPPLAAL